MAIFSHDFEFFSYPTSKGLPVQDIVQHAESIEAMVSKYSAGLDDNNDDSLNSPTSSCSTRKPSAVNEIVLLTGSTGNLGCYILASLLSKDHVRRVYTFNRKSTDRNIMDRHKAQFEDKELNVALLSSPKLVHLEGDVTLPGLGLSEKVITNLQQELTAIIHNAWNSNFSSPLSSFEHHIKGTRALIDLARSSSRRNAIRFLFTSSITMTQNWDESQGPYPETLVMDAMTAVGGGYGESKYVAERILAKSGLEVISLRIGQICGGEPNGAWKSVEWFPICVKACWYLGAIFVPSHETNWMTMDSTSDIVLEIVFHKDPLPFAANLTHPRPVSSAFILHAVRDALIQELGHGLSPESLRQVSVKEWIDMLERSAITHNAEPRNISRLLSKIIFKLPSFVTLDISNAIKLSERMRTLEPIDARLVSKWVKFWIASGDLGQSGFCEDRSRAHL
ncbi:male sterility protein-domain-containing protein [Lentinula guzmanii]|uniref:Male sterility protein-domain-containing protein n=1 Tax=Lentinula guzmanii TaxID=2804957 RepID=A0AA38N1B6_9AGAR|nr:male sterility protein-domain-containing protein [Lentinula guzmanii]